MKEFLHFWYIFLPFFFWNTFLPFFFWNTKQSKMKQDLCSRKQTQRGPAVGELPRKALPRLGLDRAHLCAEILLPCQTTQSFIHSEADY